MGVVGAKVSIVTLSLKTKNEAEFYAESSLTSVVIFKPIDYLAIAIFLTSILSSTLISKVYTPVSRVVTSMG